MREVLTAWLSSVSVFVREAFPKVNLRKFQADALARVDAGIRKLAIAASRGGGKTLASCLIVAWWIVCHPDALAVLVFPTNDEARIWWNEFRSLWMQSRLPALLPGWEIRVDSIVDGNGILRAVSVSSESPAQEGHHARALGIFFDESRLIDDATFRSTRGYLSGAEETLELATSTATPGPRGWFYRRWQSPAWDTMRVSFSEIPEIRTMVEEIAEDFDSDDPFFLSQYCAEFADGGDSEDSLLRIGWIEGAADRDVSRLGETVKVAGIDVAGGGVHADETVVCLREGAAVKKIIGWRGLDTMESCGRALDIIGEFQPSSVVCDATGLGIPFYERLDERIKESRRWGGGISLYPFRAGSSPRDKERFQNLKSERWWLARKKFEEGTISIPPDPILKTQLASITYTMNSASKIKTIDPSKSPDRADALLLAFSEEAPSVCAGTPRFLRGY